MLRVDELEAAYGARPVLRGVTLSVGRGEMVALVGRNAAGKTTLLKTIIGLLPALAGRVSLDGEDITKLPAYRRARLGIGYVPQGRLIFGDLSVHENLLVGADLAGGDPRPRVEAALAVFPGLAGRLRQSGATLSGGEQQQLAIARTLAGNPRLLLLDEPTAGVQPRVIEEIVDRLRAVSGETGLPLILVEHNIEMVTALCSRIYVMKDGAIATEIAPDQVHEESVVRSFLAI